MVDAVDVEDVAAALAVVGCWKRFCGEACSVIYRVAVEVGDRVAAGAVAVASAAAVLVAVEAAVLAVVSEAETLLAEGARVAVGKYSRTEI